MEINFKLMKRQKITIGSVIRLSLPCEKFGYGRILKNANYAFYDIVTASEIEDISKIISNPILFIVSVYNDAITSGRWVKIGKAPLEGTLEQLPMKFIQDALNPSIFELYDSNTGETKKAKMSDCVGLERAAVWEAINVEERICDHYLGRKNNWVEELRIKL